MSDYQGIKIYKRLIIVKNNDKALKIAVNNAVT